MPCTREPLLSANVDFAARVGRGVGVGVGVGVGWAKRSVPITGLGPHHTINPQPPPNPPPSPPPLVP